MNASDIMTPDVISADPDATVLQAARYMLQHHISGLPVIDKTGKLVGILSEGDFLRRRETRTDRRPSRWLEFLMCLASWLPNIPIRKAAKCPR